MNARLKIAFLTEGSIDPARIASRSSLPLRESSCLHLVWLRIGTLLVDSYLG